MSNVLMEAREISKIFPAVRVLDGVNIQFKKGSVHAIVGENGAGKSTFMNIIFGIYADYDGQLLWEGDAVRFQSPKDAQDTGIAMVHQENSLVPYLSVMDNIYLGRYPKQGPFIDKKGLRIRAEKLMREIGIEGIQPDIQVVHLSVAQKQLIEIVKALSLDAKLLMLDEPTAALTTKETAYLMNVIKELRGRGVAIVYVSHRLEEVFDISDEVTVLRDGKMVANLSKAEFNYDTVVYHMIGRNLEVHKDEGDIRQLDSADVVLEVENLSRVQDFSGVSFSVRKGEVLGFGGLVGAGRSELMEALFGYDPPTGGQVRVKGKVVKIRHPSDAINHKMGMVPEERKVKGIFGCLSVAQNIHVVTYKGLKRGFLISKQKETASAAKYVEQLRIRTPSTTKLISQLSGGNQQKAILSRWLRTDPEVLILDEPTHGVDIGAKEEIYRIIRKLARQGVSILLISSEMPELLRLCDRVAVMHEGRLETILDREDLSRDNIMRYAMGGN